jgi:L-serine dehydratase
MTANNEKSSVPLPQDTVDLLSNVDRRSFLIRHAVIGAAAAMTGATWTPQTRARQAAKESGVPNLGGTLSPDLNAVKAPKGPVMILGDEFYKVGPGARTL